MIYNNKDKWHCPSCNVKLILNGCVTDCGLSVEYGAHCPECKKDWSIED